MKNRNQIKIKKTPVDNMQQTKAKYAHISEETLRELRQSFDLFDTDRSGSIDTRQLRQAMIALGFQARNSSVFRMLSQLDSDGNGVISFEEWVGLMTTKPKVSQDRNHFEKIFKLFDNDSCGYICCNRLVEVASQLGEEVSYQQIVEMLKRADKDSDGLISFEEFYSIMAQQVNR